MGYFIDERNHVIHRPLRCKTHSDCSQIYREKTSNRYVVGQSIDAMVACVQTVNVTRRGLLIKTMKVLEI